MLNKQIKYPWCMRLGQIRVLGYFVFGEFGQGSNFYGHLRRANGYTVPRLELRKCVKRYQSFVRAATVWTMLGVVF